MEIGIHLVDFFVNLVEQDLYKWLFRQKKSNEIKPISGIIKSTRKTIRIFTLYYCMKVKILFFGQLAEKVKTNSLEMENVYNTDEVMKELISRLPVLQDQPYRIALDREIIEVNVILTENQTIALLPPYAGG